MKAWEPDQTFEKSDIGRREPNEKTRPPQTPDPSRKKPPAGDRTPGQPFREWQPASLGQVSQDKIIRRQKSEDQAPSSDLPVRLFREAVLTNLESSANLLRHWYWEKAASPGTGGLPAHDRIQLVLMQTGEAVLQHLFGILTPRERLQMQQILKRPANFRTDQFDSVRREFTERINNAR